MAGIRKKGDPYYCTFRHGGKRFYFTVGKVAEAQAQAKAAEVEELLELIDRGRLSVPDGVKFEDFIAAGGKVPVVSARPETVAARPLFDHYLATHANGTVEESSLAALRTHLTQMADSLGERFRLQGMTIADLQGHVERRRKRGLSPSRAWRV